MTLRRALRLAAGTVVLLALLYGLACGCLFLMQRHYLYLTGNPAPEIGELAAAGYEKVSYATADGLTLWGFYKAPPAADAPVLVVFHGNTGIGPIVDNHALPLARQPWGILLATYRGFEGNEGQPTEAGLQQDADAAVIYLTNKGIAAAHIILFGHSLGTAVATDLAYRMAQQETPAKALILEAPFTRMLDMAARRYSFMPVDRLLQDRFDTLGKIDKIHTPVMIMHGEADQTVPVAMGRTLCETAQIPKMCLYLPDAGHQDIFDSPAIMFPLADFVATAKP